ncbi:ATP-binding domain-containing protein [Enterobacter hormaechei subsp. steigerwaltii]|uniref:DEAD/DEAH box helicase n=1 Tax=Enterobacter hormaechei TaxID=158836 RepID=UPI00079C520F|nr:ATP-binding domain-containing protein [Enterobacter hormaechei]MCC9340749.1 ATP-binding domain-containing protein [Enterobacter hormaechei subsp. steigerwaltii]MCC9380451.1 ATP-binding domain-containing protein [Enterobacter hormaechei subsp. steigerwaltii]MCC9395033.1 ATP-binding domain-containing protein [Enterobacter hormaechei subsp. steigerwaltii]MCC9420785.1 ATP-binding domain-containing protein [Enterobacter hormaechei subsp. steigerwaltii]MCD0216620.1 ATP-binding domain-containing p
MKLNADREKVLANPEAGRLYSLLNELEAEGRLILSDSELYFDFPLYKDDDDQLVISPLMLVSRLYGIIIFYLSTSNDRDVQQKILVEEDNLDNIYGQIFSRLVKQKNLRQTKKTLRISVESCIYAPHLTQAPTVEVESEVITSKAALEKFITDLEEVVDELVYSEAASTIEGGKGLIRQKTRDVDGFPAKSKVAIVSQLESAISRFDANQLSSCVNEVDGIERIRGLAGSGKTVVLAMKVAITHLRNPEKKILYTFSTKALYQHVKRLITRFYRQFDDVDPDFDNSIKIMHAWGGTTTPGVYHNACVNNSAPFLDFGKAQRLSPKNPFSYACKTLIDGYNVQPEYDYVFVDEAQDFDSNFLQLCLKLAQNENMVFGLDVFQNIFQTTAPSINEILGRDRQLGLDKFLNKCYRTPCATLVCAHAIGLGIYRDQVQVIRTPEDWINLGYSIDESKYKNQFEADEDIIVYRTEQASPSLYHEDKENLVITQEHEDIFKECEWVANKINADIQEQGLNASDILIICADDRNYKSYYSVISEYLSSFGIDINNVNADRYNISDFSVDNKVTYSTVHKAKGNESYSVYVVGSESLYYNPNVKNRNLLFTAMTRTKGWLVMTGIGTAALELFDEISDALEKAPSLEFKYPPDTKIRQIEIDLKRVETESRNDELEKLIQEYGADGLKAMIREVEAKKVKKK